MCSGLQKDVQGNEWITPLQGAAGSINSRALLLAAADYIPSGNTPGHWRGEPLSLPQSTAVALHLPAPDGASQKSLGKDVTVRSTNLVAVELLQENGVQALQWAQ